MSESQEKAEYSQQRRKRINRLKKMILTTIALLIAVPMILCIVLGIRVAVLENRLNHYQAQATTAGIQPQDANSDPQQPDADQASKDPEGTKQETATNTDENADLADGDRTGDDRTDDAGAAEDENAIPATDDAASQTTRKVYLTFDDGPSSNTDAILDILKEYDVKATFFVLGKENEIYVPMYQRIVAEGHTLGMHSFSHEYDLIYEDIDAFRTDLHRIQDFLYDITGVVSEVYRFPGGSSNGYSRENIQEYIGYLNDMGVQYVDWNVSSQDASYPSLTSEQIVNNVLTNIEKYDTVVVLMHDAAAKDSTVEALPQIIEAIQGMDNTELLPITQEMEPVQHRRQNSEQDPEQDS